MRKDEIARLRTHYSDIFLRTNRTKAESVRLHIAFTSLDAIEQALDSVHHDYQITEELSQAEVPGCFDVIEKALRQLPVHFPVNFHPETQTNKQIT